MSINTGVAPRSANALAVETKVNEGMMTSSPGPIFARRADISNAAVQECVSSAGAPNSCESRSWHRTVKGPSPEMSPDFRHSDRYVKALASISGLENAAIVFFIFGYNGPSDIRC